MKLKKIISINLVFLLFIGIFVVFLTQSSQPSIADFSSSNSGNDSQFSAYVDRGHIYIENDTALAFFSNSGTGASGDPYIIDNYNITSTISNGITITGISQYVSIRDNLIRVSDSGIFLDGVTSGLVSVLDNTAIFCDIGIELSDSPNMLVSGNNCSFSSSIGIYLDYAPHCDVFDNTCDGNWRAMRIYISNNCTVKGNTVINNEYGMAFETSESAWIEDNICTGNTNEAIDFSNGCHYSTVTLNYCSNNFQGLHLADSEELTITRNSCILNGGEGLFLLNTVFCLVTYNSFVYSDTGLYLFEVDNTTLSNNHVVNNNFGVYFQRCESNDFHNNSMETNADYGLALDADSHYNTIHHNAFLDNGGISSQAKDEGNSNIWFEILTSEGNYWTDWGGTGIYAIDGIGGNDDLYPLGTIPVIPEIKTINILIPLMLLSITAVTILIKKNHFE